MLIGAHVVVASKDAEADHEFFRDVLKLTAVDAGGGYLIFGLPPSEASVHDTDGEVPQHELYFLCDDIKQFAQSMADEGVECSAVQDTGWGLLVKLTLPSGSPLQVYQPKHERPSGAPV